jgi:hypothetical protein
MSWQRLRRRLPGSRWIILILVAIVVAVVALLLALPRAPRYDEEALWESFDFEMGPATGPIDAQLMRARQAMPPAEWLIGATQRSSLGTHTRLVQTRAGRPILGSRAEQHVLPDGRTRLLGRMTASPRPEAVPLGAADTLTTDEAIAMASEVVGIRSTRDAPRVTAAYLPTPEGLLPVRVVLVPGLEPLGDFRVIVDERDREVRFVDDLLSRMSGSGSVFERVPGVSCQVGMDATDAQLAPFVSSVTMENLDGTGYLDGSRVRILDTLGERVQRPDLVYHFVPSNEAFDEVMSYYTIDHYFDHIRSLDIEGYDVRAIVADAHGYAGDNSFYSPSTRRITFGTGGVPDAQDPEIVLHELGHALHHTAVPDYAESFASRALSEGIADYLACSYFDNPRLAEWDAAAYSSACPPYLRRLDIPRRYPEDLVGEVHADGLIWATALWDVRAVIGSQTADEVLLKSLFFLHSASDAVHAASVYLWTAELLELDVAAIEDIFAEHGLRPGGTTSLPVPPIFARVHPNPTAAPATLRFTLPRPGRVQVDISDVRGRLVQRLLDEHRDAGSHTVVWDGRDRHGRAVSTGVYFYRVAGDRSAATGRVLLMR